MGYTFLKKYILFEKVYTFLKKYILFRKFILSLVARALSNHFVRKSILFEKVPARARLLTWRPAAWSSAFQVRQARPPPFFSTSDHSCRFVYYGFKADSAKIYTSLRNELCGGRFGRNSKADIEAPALRAT
jgi:hypothetical protein